MKKRVQWIDMAKGIGLILVMYGHIQFRPYPFYVWLCSFHMPLFFFLAGITFQVRQEEKFFSFFKKKVKALLIPYMIFSICDMVLSAWSGNMGLFQKGNSHRLGMAYA